MDNLSQNPKAVPSEALWVPQLTQDGSFTFFSEAFGETFHSLAGARQEALLKFAAATRLQERAVRSPLRLLDVCYGLGYNTAAALATIWTVNPHCYVEVMALELDATVPLGAIAPALLAPWPSEVQEILRAIAQTHHCTTPTLQAKLWIGDARQTIQSLAQQGFQADAIFFDPFSPRRCPQLWTVEFFQQVACCLAPAGILATYSRSACVRAAMLAAGLHIGSIPLAADTHLPHEWSQGTVAAFETTSLPLLSPMEQEHLQTRAAIPYRDPQLTDDAATILQRHQAEQRASQRESTSSWRKRWGIV